MAPCHTPTASRFHPPTRPNPPPSRQATIGNQPSEPPLEPSTKNKKSFCSQALKQIRAMPAKILAVAQLLAKRDVKEVGRRERGEGRMEGGCGLGRVCLGLGVGGLGDNLCLFWFGGWGLNFEAWGATPTHLFPNKMPPCSRPLFGKVQAGVGKTTTGAENSTIRKAIPRLDPGCAATGLFKKASVAPIIYLQWTLPTC